MSAVDSVAAVLAGAAVVFLVGLVLVVVAGQRADRASAARAVELAATVPIRPWPSDVPREPVVVRRVVREVA